MLAERTQIQESLRRQGVRCTPQRFAILEYLARSHDHPTAEEIHRAINRARPTVSLATVYKTLHALARAELVREIRLDGDAVRYESNTGRHHHFLCERCGRMEDMGWFEIPRLPKRAALGTRKLRAYEVILRGLCGHCS